MPQDLNNIKMNYYNICKLEKCTACGACYNICPRNAINMKTDVYGSIHPYINADLCVHCGACKKICTVNHPLNKMKPIMCYAAQRSDQGKRIHSASGGIGALISEEMYSKGSVVFGCVMDKNGFAHHVQASNTDDLDRMRLSKYVHSDTEITFQEAGKSLREGRHVLYIGTPCQIAGLINFLHGRKDNLITVDLVCHGTPNQVYLKDHIKKISHNMTIDNVTFRGGKDDFTIKVYKDNSIIYTNNRKKDTYYRAFMERMTYRESCYSCPYACPERVGDLTIGDFWKLDRASLNTKMEGRISVVLINSENGKKIWTDIKEKCIWEERTYEEAISGNPNLNRPTERSDYREQFLKAYSAGYSFDEAFFKSGIKMKYIKDCVKDTTVWKMLRRVAKR